MASHARVRAVAEMVRAMGTEGAEAVRLSLARALAERGGPPSRFPALLSAAQCLVGAASHRADACESSLAGAALAMSQIDDGAPGAMRALCELLCVLPPPFVESAWQRPALDAMRSLHVADAAVLDLFIGSTKCSSMSTFSWRAFPAEVAKAWRDRTPRSRVGIVALLGRGMSAVAEGARPGAARTAAGAVSKAVDATFRGAVADAMRALCSLAHHCIDAEDVGSGLLLLVRALRAGFAMPAVPDEQRASLRTFELGQPSRSSVLAEARRCAAGPAAPGAPVFPELIPGLRAAGRAGAPVPVDSPHLEFPEDAVAAAFTQVMAGLGTPAPSKLTKKRAREVLEAAVGRACSVHLPMAAAPPRAPVRVVLSRGDVPPPPAWIRSATAAPPVDLDAAHDMFAEDRSRVADLMLYPASDTDDDGVDAAGFGETKGSEEGACAEAKAEAEAKRVRLQWVATYRDADTNEARDVLIAMGELPRAVRDFDGLRTKRRRPPPSVRLGEEPPELRELARRLCALPPLEARTAALPAPMRRDGRLGERARWLIDLGRGDEVPEHVAYLNQASRAYDAGACPLP